MTDPSNLMARLHRFALNSLRFYDTLPPSPRAQVPGVQYYRASTGANANYRAARRGRSRAEFISKLGTAVEEIDEALGWLVFMRDSSIAADPALIAEADELLRILNASLTTARANATAEKTRQPPTRRATS
jgi:four helix bundle protein